MVVAKRILQLPLPTTILVMELLFYLRLSLTCSPICVQLLDRMRQRHMINVSPKCAKLNCSYWMISVLPKAHHGPARNCSSFSITGTTLASPRLSQLTDKV